MFQNWKKKEVLKYVLFGTRSFSYRQGRVMQPRLALNSQALRLQVCATVLASFSILFLQKVGTGPNIGNKPYKVCFPEFPIDIRSESHWLGAVSLCFPCLSVWVQNHLHCPGCITESTYLGCLPRNQIKLIILNGNDWCLIWMVILLN